MLSNISCYFNLNSTFKRNDFFLTIKLFNETLILIEISKKNIRNNQEENIVIISNRLLQK